MAADIPFRVIIAGGRDYTDYLKVWNCCDFYLSNKVNGVEVLTGGAGGADALGKQYADLRNYSNTIYLANWKSYGKTAGPIRNERMVKNADALIAFWDGLSKGTGNIIKLAKRAGLLIRVISYDPIKK